MYDWVDDFRIQARQSFPHLANLIDQYIDLGDVDLLLEVLLDQNI